MSPLIPAHSPVLRTRSSGAGGILATERARQYSEFLTLIVQSNAVDVVTFESVARRESQQGAVKRYLAGIFSNATIAFSVAVTAEVPGPLVDELSVSCIDDGVGSDRTVEGAERDLYGIFVRHRDSIGLGVVPRAVLAAPGRSHADYTPPTRSNYP